MTSGQFGPKYMPGLCVAAPVAVPHISFLTEPTFVIADETMVKRVVDNLISNAMNYGIDELKIIISKDDNVSVAFQNTVQDGQRIDINKLFNKFYTADLSRNHSGTGLGLYIVKLLMEKMGGSVKGIFTDNVKVILLLSL